MAPSTAAAFRRLIKLYLFDRPEGEWAPYILVDVARPEVRLGLMGLLDRMVLDGEVIKNIRPNMLPLYQLSTAAWLKLVTEEPECRIRELKKRKFLRK